MRTTLIAAVSAAVLGIAAPAAAQTVLTVSAEQTTTWVRNFNPFGQTSARFTTLDFIYEPLVVFNRLKGNEPHFRLAESFELADDLKSITFKLRDGLKWSDGEPLTADDVVFTYDYIKKFPALDFISISAQLASVEKVDDTTVRFNLNEPNSLIANTIVSMPIVPAHIWSKIDDPVTFANENPVGSGPLTEITRFTPQVYEQCRNPNYWDATNLAIDCMRLPQLADNPQVLAALAEGSLDWATSFIPDIDNTFVAKDPEHHKYWFTPSSLVSFQLSMTTPDENNRKAFNDVNFRRALSMLIDRQTIVDIAGYGYPLVNEDPSGLGELYKAFANPEVATQFGQYGKFDKDAGIALLDSSGYVDANGDGFRDNPDGTPIAIDIEVPNGWTDWIDAVQISMETLQEAGINVKMSTPEAAVWTQDLIDGKYSMTLNALAAAANPYFPYIRSFNPGDFGKSRFTAPHWDNAEVMDLLGKYTQVKDPAEQKALMDKAQMIVAEALPLIPVYNSPSFYEYNTKRFTGWADAENPFISPVVSNANPGRLIQLLALRPVSQ
ncbi:MAG: ABC transporter substrate-binding protein [Paradevosia shaoguanensis]|uniref:ABC transporter substrate-binding protein n=1 Tax=Paradevosia shaoguanensis TaxID=1335043 RepID=A0AA41QND2_9HYPH|nr:ABC transporter substrate-binding protein [Paradevosia shaoguanensis]MCF1742516.1 ABC transporter substrate-binding protein [Paradevosia shaoguanensis]MCI0126999.1 ABC transporter substrate-binding protein [Paradevosia shaoguanensis]